jgi:hypothetical protein
MIARPLGMGGERRAVNLSEPTLQIGDVVMLRHGAALPPHSHVEPGTVGRVVFLDDTDPSAVSVQFANSSRLMRLRREDIMTVAGDAPENAPATESTMAAAPLRVGDRVEILAAIAQPKGQPTAPRRYGWVREVEDENGRAAVEVDGRQHPLHLPVQQLRRVDR